MRFFIGLVLALALGVMGCSESGEPDFPCTEQGIRDAIAEGGGPHHFGCDGPTTVVTNAEIVIDNDVSLDGEGELAVSGSDQHRVFSVPEGVTAELAGLTVTEGLAAGFDGTGGGILNLGSLSLTGVSVEGNSSEMAGGGIANSGGTLTLMNSTVSGNAATGRCTTFCGGGGIHSFDGTLMLMDSAVSGNTSEGSTGGGGVFHLGGPLIVENSTIAGNTDAGTSPMSRGGAGGIYILPGRLDFLAEITNSTVSGNTSEKAVGGINVSSDEGFVLLSHSTVAGNTGSEVNGIYGTLAVAASLVEGGCGNAAIDSGGYNIESEGDTCNFDQPTDQVNVSADDLKLGELADNGGPTLTHALGAGSVAIDQIPEAECVDADDEPLTTDQRGEPRDSMCDVGAFEVQP